MNRKIDILINYDYVASTTRYKNLKECLNSIKQKGYIDVAKVNKIEKIVLKNDEDRQEYYNFCDIYLDFKEYVIKTIKHTQEKYL